MMNKWNQQVILHLGLWVIVSCLFTCSQKAENTNDLAQQAFQAIPAELPPPIKGKRLENLQPPTVIPLKKQPKSTPAHQNVHAAGTPSVVQIPDEVPVITFGENGVPFPITVPVQKTIVTASHPKPVPALAPAFKDDAVYDINYLSDEQGMQFGGGALLEDSRGNFWFGGTAGVVRYDGKNFFHYTPEEGFPDIVYALIEDRNGNIWMACEKGLWSYDGHQVTRYTVDQESNDGFQLESCRMLMEDTEGNIWFSNMGTGAAGAGSGAYRFDGNTFTVFGIKYWTSIPQEGKLQRNYNHRVNEIFEDSRGQIWWATHGSGVLRYDGRQIIQYTRKEGLIDDVILTIQEDNNGNIWFGSGWNDPSNPQKGLSCYKPDLAYPKDKGGTFSNFTLEDGLNDNVITGIMKDDSGNLWFSTYREGISRYDGKTFTHFKAEQGLNPIAITVLQDQYQNIWTNSLGRSVAGAARGDEEVSRFQPNSFVHFTEKQGLSNPTVSAVQEDRKGNIWLGTLGGGVIKYDGQNFTTFTKEQGLCSNEIYSILEDRTGNLWFASTNNGVSRFDGKVFTNYSTGQGITFNLVWDIFEDTSGNLWFVCGTQGGVVRFNPETEEFTQFDDDAWFGRDGIGLGSCSIHEDSQHNIWVGGVGWMLKHNPERDQMEVMYLIDREHGEWIEYMLEDSEGNLWFGSETRLVKVNKEETEGENKFTLFTQENGLPDGKIQTIIEDKQQNVWISSDKGLSLLVGGLENMGKKDWIQYGKPDGLKSTGYICKSVYLDSKNRMWWGTSVSGVTMLDLNTFSIPTEAPKSISLSDVEINEEYIDYGKLSDTAHITLAFGKTVAEGIDSVASFYNYPTSLKLSYDLNHLTFHFSAIDWTAPHKIQFSFKLDGVDPTWSLPSAETKADYRNLPFGTFTFHLKAIGEANVWSEPFAYTFTISPPWWYSWWAYGAYVVLAVGAIGGYVIRLRRKIKEKQEQLEREQYLNRELRELNIATSRFVPRDFLKILDKNTLNQLQLGDQTQANMTVLFADIRGYTLLSESMTPEQNFKFINAYLGRMGPIIQAHGGFICQYYGDGIMALFKDNHDQAIKAAIEMQQALQRYNRKRFARNRQPVQVGIGLNTGQLMLGVIGDEQRYDTSVISDAVNTASRMEGLTKIFGCQVIVSETTLMELNISTEPEGKDTAAGDYRFLGKVKVKGKDQVLKIYDFYDGETEEIRDLKTETKPLFEKALQLYYEREFGKAADVFKVILEKHPGDVATHYYMDRSVEYVIDGVDEKWSGVEEMVSK